MIIYEVNIAIEQNCFDGFMQWLIPHIQEMLTIDGFEKARLCQMCPESDLKPSLQVQYTLSSQAALDQYFEHQAPMMRQQATSRFADKIKVSRNQYTVLEQW